MSLPMKMQLSSCLSRLRLLKMGFSYLLLSMENAIEMIHDFCSYECPRRPVCMVKCSSKRSSLLVNCTRIEVDIGLLTAKDSFALLSLWERDGMPIVITHA